MPADRSDDGHEPPSTVVQLLGEAATFSVTVRGRDGLGLLPDHDHLRVRYEFSAQSLSFVHDEVRDWHTFDDWSARLTDPGRDTVVWSDDGRSPDLSMTHDSGVVTVTFVDHPQSGLTIELPIEISGGWDEWKQEQAELLAEMRTAYPRRVVETGPSSYAWAPHLE